MLKPFLFAITLTAATVIFDDRPTGSMIVILPSAVEGELPVGGIEIVQGDRKQTFWLYSEPETRSVSENCDDLKRGLIGG